MPLSWSSTSDEETPLYRMRLPRAFLLVPIVILLGFGAVLCTLAYSEMRTSRFQSEWFTNLTSGIHLTMEPGLNPKLRYPSTGPYNQRLGYSYLPFFIKSLTSDNYTVAWQARPSPAYQKLINDGLYPIYHAKTVTGLMLYDHEGQPLYAASYPNHIFSDFRSIPPLLVNTLLYIENRELLQPGPATRNPVIEWDRFLFAAFGHMMQYVVPGFNAGGGSTLATQIEKFRYSPGGETRNAMDKLRQIISGSLRAYLDGPDTREVRKQIVLDYLNSTTLSARPGFGEVNSIGDGLWAWFGQDLNEAITALNLPESDPDSLRTKAHVYREVLGLILAQRRPTYYLLTDREELDDLTDVTLDRLKAAGIISDTLREASKAASFRFLADPPQPPQTPFIEQKATNSLRNHLLSMLGLKNLYELDRLDLAAVTTLDETTQQKVVDFLRKMSDKNFLQSIGLYGFRLLAPENDPTKIKWSVILYERGNDANRIRVQADNIDEPFDMNEGVKLDLGSTAKLRTLVTYLEIIDELYQRYDGVSLEDLQSIADDAPDNLTTWATTWMAKHPDGKLDDILEAAMDRTYSGNPSEVFFTGGGEHSFVNFEKSENVETMDLREAFRNSVNLVFVRLMRDVVNYMIAQGPVTKQELLDDPDQPARKAYLERYADREGSVFLSRYMSDYIGSSPDDALDKLTSHGHSGATAHTIIFRSVLPHGSFDEYVAYMNRHPVRTALDGERLKQLYNDYPVTRYNLADRGYIAGVNPLELWLVSYLQANPKASRNAILAVSKQMRVQSYAWLFNPRLKHAQDTRIRIILELDAFKRIQQHWARLGYPFDRLVPSYATAIGSSADRPDALAELVGLILNDGIKVPTARFDTLQFGANTPYQTVMVHNGPNEGEHLLNPAIARIVKAAMIDVAENGTAKRIKGAYVDGTGKPLLIGGKTGTGDHRYDEFGAGGKLISSRVVNRTGTFVFFIGDRFFGTITAHVAGEDAANYNFSSALAVQTLKSLAPIFQPLINGAPMTAQNGVIGSVGQ